HQGDNADGRAFAQHRNTKHSPEVAQLLSLGPNIVARHTQISNMNGATFQQRQPRDGPAFRLYRDSSDVFCQFSRETIGLSKKELSVYLPRYGGFVGIAKSCG